jgi:hypothetical protein
MGRFNTVVFAVLAAVLTCSACAPSHNLTEDPSFAREDRDNIESACQSQLTYLNAMIANYFPYDETTRLNLIEAKELYNISEELYLRKDYSLALELIDKAIKIIEESSE